MCARKKCCNGNPTSTFPPYYGFHTLTNIFNRPGVAEAALQTPHTTVSGALMFINKSNNLQNISLTKSLFNYQ